jgi:hypothetical protein
LNATRVIDDKLRASFGERNVCDREEGVGLSKRGGGGKIQGGEIEEVEFEMPRGRNDKGNFGDKEGIGGRHGECVGVSVSASVEREEAMRFS